MSSLKDKVILITGSGDVEGIGAATAVYMTQYHPKLVLTGRDKIRLELVADQITSCGLSIDRILLIICDLTSDSEMEKVVKRTLETFGHLDVLINNAAVTHYSDTQETKMRDFDHVIKTNIRSPFYLTKLCIPHLIKSQGCIVNVSSIYGQRACMGETAYCMSKAALDQFTAVLALELAEHGIRVNSVNPGIVKTKTQRKGGMDFFIYLDYIGNQKYTHPLGRAAKPMDVAKAITYLASDNSSFITGQHLFVDGGRHKANL